MQGEEELVKRAQHREQEAFAQLYEAYFDKIYRYIFFKIGSEMEAEDMTQQVFLKALESISSFKWQGKPFSTWLYRIAHNQIVDYFRRKTKRAVVPLEEAPAILSTDDPQAIAEQSLDIERVVSATTCLTDMQKECISLRFASGLSIAEVAQIMGKSEGAIKALQHSAIIALRKVLVVTENETV